MGIVKALILPPGNILILLMLAFVLLLTRWKQLGIKLFALGIIVFYCQSTFFFVDKLVNLYVPSYPPVDAIKHDSNAPQAIVVLGCRYLCTAHRLRYAVQLSRFQPSLPLILSGGHASSTSNQASTLLVNQFPSELLERYQSLPPLYFEKNSRNTYDNARETVKLMNTEGLPLSIILVTDPVHMRRAAYTFQQFNFDVIPAPPHSYRKPNPELKGVTYFLPSINAFKSSNNILYEMIGMVWYRLRVAVKWRAWKDSNFRPPDS